MVYSNGSKTSAELEREVNEQRDRVEARIGEIKERLSPGQLVDELLSYSKGGGSQFAGNFAHQVTSNPIPAALVGVGLVWLMGSNMGGAGNTQALYTPQPRRDRVDHPYAKVQGSGLKRVKHAADEAGQWWSEFQSDTGSKFKAQSDDLGNRAGHFTDEAGKKFSGFIDDAGNRVQQFRDEAGNAIDDTKGWASHNWDDARHSVGERVHGVADAASRARDGLMSGSRDLGGTVQAQTDQISRQIVELFDKQPLIAGALAFAAGAALGAALPHTEQEDQLVGEQADKVRGTATEKASELYQQGKDKAAEVYDDASHKAGDLYDEAKDRIAGATQGSLHQ